MSTALRKTHLISAVLRCTCLLFDSLVSRWMKG